jgi:ABC-type xylose transport system permease subunit
MKRIVLRFGLASGAILILTSALVLLCVRGTIDFDHGQIFGYAAMVLSFLMVFFGIRSYRDHVGAGAIGFGKAFQVGILITLITCAIYVVSWEIAYFNFFPDFLDQYNAHVLLKMRAKGASPAAIQEATMKMAEMAKHYGNPLYNSAITFMEVFPVGLIVTLFSAAVLRRKPRGPEGGPAEALTT